MDRIGHGFLRRDLPAGRHLPGIDRRQGVAFIVGELGVPRFPQLLRRQLLLFLGPGFRGQLVLVFRPVVGIIRASAGDARPRFRAIAC